MCAPMAAVTKVLKSNLSAATAAAGEAAEAATSDEREAKLAQAEVSLALNRAVAVEYRELMCAMRRRHLQQRQRLQRRCRHHL